MKYIKICFDENVDSGDLIDGKEFNYNTLEPKLLKANNLEIFNKVLGTDCKSTKEMHKYMKTNKTKCALNIFKCTETLSFPKYILDAIE